MTALELNLNQYLELEKIALGAFLPVTGFMNADEFASVVERESLPDGTPFPIPILLDLPVREAEACRGAKSVELHYDGLSVGRLFPDSYFAPDRERAAARIFGTLDPSHPGVANFMALADVFVGGRVEMTRRAALPISSFELTPSDTKARFAELGFKTVVGFQTRNVPHRAHEYLQRTALEMVDGLFIQPLVGQKKAGDYTPEAIMTGYRRLIRDFYPPERVVLGVLSTAMRYAGPREAVFHAIVRRNYGCTHFIVGRDHAGVGGFYGKYDAHKAVAAVQDRLGIEVMRLSGPYHCGICDGIVTEKTCPHEASRPDAVRHINGADMRALLVEGREPDRRLMRPEIIESLQGLRLFI